MQAVTQLELMCLLDVEEAQRAWVVWYCLEGGVAKVPGIRCQDDSDIVAAGQVCRGQLGSRCPRFAA